MIAIFFHTWTTAIHMAWTKLKLRLNMNHLMKQLKHYISYQETDPIEYGNLRKGAKWGASMGNRLVWTFSVDLIWKKSLQYKVVYNSDEKKFIGFSNFDRYAQQNRLIQFSTKNFASLREKIIQLAHDIPTFRERILREYLFEKTRNKVNLRWSKVFVNEEQKTKEKEYLINLVKHIHESGRISESELDRSIHYITRIKSI